MLSKIIFAYSWFLWQIEWDGVVTWRGDIRVAEGTVIALAAVISPVMTGKWLERSRECVGTELVGVKGGRFHRRWWKYTEVSGEVKASPLRLQSPFSTQVFISPWDNCWLLLPNSMWGLDPLAGTQKVRLLDVHLDLSREKAEWGLLPACRRMSQQSAKDVLVQMS